MNTYFPMIVGYDAEKEELKRFCDVLNRREEIEEKGATLPKGIIFYGPTGSGKTLFAKALADQCNLKTYTIDASNMDHATSINRNIRKAFRRAEKHSAPAMVIFDEIDKFLPNDDANYHTDRTQAVLTQLLTLIDGINSANNVVFVATCNDYSLLPPMLVRPGRIDKKIYLGYPDLATREALLQHYFAKSPCQLERPFHEVAKLCAGFSCAAIETFVNECILLSDEQDMVSKELILNKIAEIKNETIAATPSATERKIMACKNVGHWMVAHKFQPADYTLSCEPFYLGNCYFNAIAESFDDRYTVDNEETDCDDYDEDDYSDENTVTIHSTKKVIMQTICVALGGYVAQELYLHRTYKNYTELSLIDDLILYMFNNGMLGLDLYYCEHRAEQLPYSGDHYDHLNEAFDNIINDCYNRTKEILTKYYSFMEDLIPHLAEREYLTPEDVNAFLDTLPE